MALASGTYGYRDHLVALIDQLKVAPILPFEKKALRDLSLGKANDRIAAQAAMSRLSAPSKPSAFYAWLATGQEDDPLRLTDFELEAIRLLASGANAREIGEAAGLATENSQRNRGGELLRMARGKLDAENNTHLVRLAARYRLIEPLAGDPPLPPWTP